MNSARHSFGPYLTNDDLQKQFQEQSENSPLQTWVTDRLQKDIEAGENPFSWFVMGPNGVQLAREPKNVPGRPVPIGRCFSFRSYFTGKDTDYGNLREYIDHSNGEHIRGIRLSAVFLTKVTDQWVVVVSAPVEDETGTFLGVVGLMIKLGRLAELPGEETENRFTVLVHPRGNMKGAIVQHPALDPNARVPDEILNYRVRLDEMGETEKNYRDPMCESRGEYDQRWLAAKAPVHVFGQRNVLFLLAQQSYDDMLGVPLQELRRSVILLSVTGLGLVVVFLAPLWALVLRMLK